MNEMVINFDEIQKTLEPFFAGKIIRIILEGDEAKILTQRPQKKPLKSRGIFSDHADLDMVKGEKGAWERAVVEKYAKDNT